MSESTGKADHKIYALQYAELGLRVFPAHYILKSGRCSCGKVDCGSPGKHPLPQNGLLSATTDLEKIGQFWTVNPLANIAIRTGAEFGFWALDLDGIEGIRDLNQLAEQHPDLPESDTGGDGRHLFFRYPDGGIHNATKLAGKNIDVRGTGGYVIVAPSNHVSGQQYRWRRDPFKYDLEPAPGWLLKFARNRSPNDKPKEGRFVVEGTADFRTEPGTAKG